MMSELATTATRLRLVREAEQMFLELWALEKITAQVRLLDHVVEDLKGSFDVEMEYHPSGDLPVNVNFRESGRAAVHRRGIMDD